MRAKVQEIARAVSQDRVYGHTRSGKPITYKEIETLSAAAGAGYDVDTLLARRAKRGRPALGSAPASVESHIALSGSRRQTRVPGPTG